jgi:integrase
MPILKEAWLRAPKDAAGHPWGRVIGVNHIGDAFARFARTTSTPWVTPHVLRHTWGSLKAMRGVPLYDIAQVMGDTMATIEANYLHLSPDHLRRAVNA